MRKLSPFQLWYGRDEPPRALRQQRSEHAAPRTDFQDSALGDIAQALDNAHSVFFAGEKMLSQFGFRSRTIC